MSLAGHGGSQHRYNIVDTRTGKIEKSVIAVTPEIAMQYAKGLSVIPGEFIEVRDMGAVKPCCSDCGKKGAAPCGEKKHEHT